MPGKEDNSEFEDGDFEPQDSINFRDYPSTGLVVVAALVSGLSLMVYKWAKGKRTGKPASSGEQKASGGGDQLPPSPAEAITSGSSSKEGA
jgi:hypothetical protein